MPKKWKVAIGVIAIAVVVVVIALSFLSRWVIFRSRDVPFVWGFGPGRGVPFGRGFGPGRVLPFGPIFGPFAIVGGLAHLVFFALLIGLVIVFFRRCYQRGDKPGSVTPESSNH